MNENCPKPYELVDDGPATKLLKALYGKDEGRIAGTTFHERNRRLHQKKIESGWVPTVPTPEPKSPPVIKTKINVPKVGVAKKSEECVLPSKTGRRMEAQIRHQMEEEFATERSRPVAPSGPLLDEKEKGRCQLMMEYHGKVPQELLLTEKQQEVIKQQKAEARARLKPRGDKEQLEAFFSQIVAEVDERKQFMDEMTARGQLKKNDAARIRGEIAERMRELRKIDNMIRGLASSQPE